MRAKRMIKLLGIDVSKKQLKACKWLERRGLVFCVDFGVGNAIQIKRAQKQAASR